MTDLEFDDFVANCVSELRRKQQSLEQQYGLGRLARWAFDGNSGLLTFFDRYDRPVVRADTTEIGSYSLETHTWKWAWANPSLPDARRAKSQLLKGLQDLTGFEVFGRDDPFAASEERSWEMAAMSVHHLSARGCYRGPAKHLYVFFAIDAIDGVASKGAE
jgi:hypothetical protein